MVAEILKARQDAERGAQFALRYAALGLVLVIGLLLRCRQIDYSFDADEVFSIRLATLPFTDMLAGAMADTPHPPLHIILLHLWSGLFGASETAARALSVSLSGAFLLVAWRLLRRFLVQWHWLALGTLAILAVSPLFVLYGQQARPYALITLLAALNLLAFLRFLDGGDWRGRGLCWALSCAALLYTQYMGILLIAVELAYVLTTGSARSRQFIGCAALGCVAVLPWALMAMGASIQGFDDPLPQVKWMTAPASTDFAWFYVSIFGEARVLRVRWVLLLAALAACLVVRRALARRIAPEHALLVALAVVPPLLVYLLSVLGDKPLFASRQLLGSALAFVLITGLCAAALPRVLGHVSLAALVAWAAISVHDAFPAHAKPPWREIAAFVGTHYPAQPVLAGDWWIETPFDHYARAGRSTPISLYRASNPGAPALFLCRATRCTRALEVNGFTARAQPVRRWSWGGAGELELFELRAAAGALRGPPRPDGVALPALSPPGAPDVVRPDPEPASPSRIASL